MSDTNVEVVCAVVSGGDSLSLWSRVQEETVLSVEEGLRLCHTHIVALSLIPGLTLGVLAHFSPNTRVEPSSSQIQTS